MVFKQMEDRGHERVLFAQDADSGLRAIIAIHDTTLGPALGGVRRWHYATEAEALDDVLRLSQAMTYKAAAARLPMGGAKSVIFLRQPNEEPKEAMARAMGRVVDTLRGDYIAAEDVGVDTQYIDWMAQETSYVMGGEKVSRGGDPSPYTARGVVNGMKAALRFLGESPSFEGRVVAIQGLGHVGYNIARILVDAGATVKATDISAKRVERARADLGIEMVPVDEILTTECDILCPCALGGAIGGHNIPRLRCRMVVGAANNPLAEPFQDAAELMARGIVYAPDFVINAGGLIQLAGLWLDYSPEMLERKIAEIEQTTLEILQHAEEAGSSHAAAVEYAQRVIREGVSTQAAEGAVHAG